MPESRKVALRALREAITASGKSEVSSFVEKVLPLVLPAQYITLATAVAAFTPLGTFAGLVIPTLSAGVYAFERVRSIRGEAKAAKEAERLMTLIAGMQSDLAKLQRANAVKADIVVALMKAGVEEPEAMLVAKQLGSDGDPDSIDGEISGEKIDQMVVTAFEEFRNSATKAVREAAETAFRSLCVQREEALLTSLRKVLNEPKVELPRKSGATDSRSASRLVFAEQLVPRLIGRDREMADLREFRDDPTRKFSWWWWYGEGGMGKSRLALEWLYESLGKWQGGFLNLKYPHRFDQWTPEGPTLFVVDYARSCAEHVHQVLADLSARSDKLPFPVRVLLLEREYDRQDQWDAVIWSESKKSGPRVRKAAFRAPAKLEPLQLDEFYRAFEVAYLNLKGRSVPIQIERKVRQFFRPETFSKRRYRPLYAGLTALLVADQGDRNIERWRAEDLERYVLDHERQMWQNWVDKPTACDMNALFIATLRRSISEDEFLDLPERMRPCVKGPNAERVQRMASHSESNDAGYMGIEPDLIGEAYVMARLKGQLTTDGETSGSAKNCSWKLLDRLIEEGAFSK